MQQSNMQLQFFWDSGGRAIHCLISFKLMRAKYAKNTRKMQIPFYQNINHSRLGLCQKSKFCGLHTPEPTTCVPTHSPFMGGPPSSSLHNGQFAGGGKPNNIPPSLPHAFFKRMPPFSYLMTAAEVWGCDGRKAPSPAVAGGHHQHRPVAVGTVGDQRESHVVGVGRRLRTWGTLPDRSPPPNQASTSVSIVSPVL